MHIVIRVNLDIHGITPHQKICEVVEHLARVVVNASEEAPALGGALYNLDGKPVGSYLIIEEK